MYTTYPQDNTYAPSNGYQGYAPMQQPMRRWPAAPAAQASSANMGLLMVAGLAVVGAAAFGGVYLMNSVARRPARGHAAAAVDSRQPALQRSRSRR